MDFAVASLVEFPLVAGAFLAWSLAAPPGPANALIANEAARRGFAAGWWTGLGAVTGDLTMFLLMRFGLLRLIEGRAEIFLALGIVGCALMAWFAWEAWRAARRHGEMPEPHGRGSFGRSYVTVISSPFNWAWWLGFGATYFLGLGWLAVIGFFGGLLLWIVAWSGLARTGAAKLRRFTEVVAYASAVVLAVFAALLAGYVAQLGVSLVGGS